ncbi:MAG: PDDEXK nuclease domain-containing protein [Kiritimatiellae bacterium]|nr:PDDEXK nuclease domain-containing protein [Kiritimatiellia bacterium]
MNELLTGTEYLNWIAELKAGFRATQIKAAVSVNRALLEFYWKLGRDIFARENGKSLSMKALEQLSHDLRREIPGSKCFSAQNLYYIRGFYKFYSSLANNVLTFENDENSNNTAIQQLVEKLVKIPWGHHVLIMNKCSGNVEKALFYVEKTIENNWSRNSLLNWISTDLYGREGKAISNFREVLAKPDGDLAQQLTKDPYIFDVQGLTPKYNEDMLKRAMTANVEKLLVEMGKGFSFVGREYPMVVGGEDKQIDLLFYFIPLHRYFVVEVKLGEFEPADLGQLQGYVAAVDLTLNRPGDNPAMGLLVCKGKNSVLAKYMVNKVDMPLAVSDYELSGIIPEQFKSDLPSIEELEAELT